MMRLSFERLDGAPDGAALAPEFSTIGNAFGMNWQIHDASKRARVLIMMSKFDHCANDLGAKPQAHARGIKGPIIEQQVERVTHSMSADELVSAGRDVECQALARAVRDHVERRVFLNGQRTVVFR